MPPNTVSVARPSKWGNPFVIERGVDGYMVRYGPPGRDLGIRVGDLSLDEARRVAADGYRYLLLIWRFPLEELRGKNLACYCPLGEPCHADVLLELANR